MFLRHIIADANVMCGYSLAWRQVARWQWMNLWEL